MRAIIAGENEVTSPDVFAQAMSMSGWESVIEEVYAIGHNAVTTMARDWAKKRRIPIHDASVSKKAWRKSKAAGALNRRSLCQVADALIVIGDAGSEKLIEEARHWDLHVYVYVPGAVKV